MYPFSGITYQQWTHGNALVCDYIVLCSPFHSQPLHVDQHWDYQMSHSCLFRNVPDKNGYSYLNVLVRFGQTAAAKSN